MWPRGLEAMGWPTSEQTADAGSYWWACSLATGQVVATMRLAVIGHVGAMDTTVFGLVEEA